MKINGHSMVDTLKTVMVCPPENAGWGDARRAARWQELGFLHEPNFEAAKAQHAELCRQLEAAGAQVIVLPASEILTIDAVYAHDVTFPTDEGVIVLNPGKANRAVESAHQALFLKMAGARMFRGMEVPGTVEAGDMVWLDEKKLLIGLGFRTNPDGIRQIHQMLVGFGIEIIAAPLPYGAGPKACLHLMSLMSMLDENTVLVDRPWMAVKTVQLLDSRGMRLIDIDASERETLACNVLALGEGRLLAIKENRKTNEKLRAAGFDVRTFPGSELCVNGGGGPTCLTRALWRG